MAPSHPRIKPGQLLLIAAAIGVAVLRLPEIGLAVGIALGIAGLVTVGSLEKKISRYLIQVCVVLLGLRMDLHEVMKAGTSGLLFAVGTIASTFALGWLLGKWLRIDGRLTTLISSGTAVCGGSAIAAVGSVIRASTTHMSVATGTIFILNAAALYVFPVIGQNLHLTATQFGTWAGVAIHDVSSVVGAGSAFDRIAGTGHIAVETATVVKLSRVLWIIPICTVAAYFVPHDSASDNKRKFPVPWFVVFFFVAAALRTAQPTLIARADAILLDISKRGMTIALLLIGAGLTWKALKAVGPRPLIQGVILWVFISVTALFVVKATVV